MTQQQNRLAASARRVGLVLLVAGLAACGTVPVPPVAVVPGGDAETSDWREATVHSAELPQPRWWQQFDDVGLSQLVDAALSDNYTLAQAQARLRRAAALRTQASSLRWPTLVAQNNYTWADQSINSPVGGASLISAGFIDRDLEFWGVSVGVNWDTDLFGANRKRAQAAGFMNEAARVAVAASQVAVQGAVVSAYYQYRGAERQYALLEANITKQAEALALIEKRQRIGLESMLNVNRAAGQLATSRTQLPLLMAQRRAVFHQLASLTVLPPESLQTLLDSTQRQSSVSREVSVGAGIKSDLLRRRPDIAINEMAMHAAAYEVGAAQANRLPNFTLSAQAGLESGRLSSLFDGASRTLGIVPGVTTPLFNRGRLKAQRDAALARYEESIATFQQVVLQAISETETRLAELAALREARIYAVMAFEQDGAAAERAKKLYDRGLLAYLELLDAQRQALRSEAAMVTNDVALRQAQVALFIALGGGWQMESLAAK